MHIAERISQYVVQSDNDCWEFVRTKSCDGYGVISYQCKQHRVHRLVWELNVGPIPDGLNVLHTCDNRCCCNPDHLFLGTHQDNVDDMIAKGRDSYGENIGSNNGQAKLNEDEVREIKQLLKSKQYTHEEIANAFNVSRATITVIGTGKNWGWLND